MADEIPKTRIYFCDRGGAGRARAITTVVGYQPAVWRVKNDKVFIRVCVEG